MKSMGTDVIAALAVNDRAHDGSHAFAELFAQPG